MTLQIVGAVLCLIVAVVYYFVWPGWKKPERRRRTSHVRRFILRWFHSLTWILLAATCLLWSKIPALLSLVVYLIFLAAVVLDKSTVRRR